MIGIANTDAMEPPSGEGSALAHSQRARTSSAGEPREGPQGQRYVALDGLRGVAALLVVAHHIQAVTNPEGVFSRGYLDVDFFFALSGFVIAAAYERRMAAGLGVLAFANRRIGRLYPLVFAGVVIAALVGPFAHPESATSLAVVSQLLLIPALGGGSMLFALNRPHWSLLFELGANLAHALLFRWATTKRLTVFVALAAVGLVLAAHKYGHNGGGWSTRNWPGGVARVAFSYPLGVLIYRLKDRLPRLDAPFLLPAALLVLLVLACGLAQDWRAEVATVILAFPLVLWLGLSAKTTGLIGESAAWLGFISYPLYATHAPLVDLWGVYASHSLASAVGLVAACILVARAALAFETWSRMTLAPRSA